MSKNNDYMREYMAKRYERRKAEAQEYLGGKCAECREAWNKHSREYKRRWRAEKRASLVST